MERRGEERRYRFDRTWIAKRDEKGERGRVEENQTRLVFMT
jgi:hypothetical protein